METSFENAVKSAVKNWWMSLIAGILLLIIGLWMMFFPLSSYMALSIVFSACMFVSGLFEILLATGNYKNLDGWGWYLAAGIIDFILGFFLLCYPGITMAIIPFIVAFWLMFRGFSTIGFAIDMHRWAVRNWGWYLTFGILAVLCSLWIMFQPLAGGFIALFMVSFTLVIVGISRIMLSFDLRDLHKKIEHK